MQNFERAFAVVGADRVGKSTFVKNLQDELLSNVYSPEQLTIAHFSGPTVEDNSPIDQYTRVLDKVNTKAVICDRFGSEVCFYEKFRRNFTISEEWAHSVESYIVNRSTHFSLVYIKAPWALVESRHKEEISENWPDTTLYYQNLLLGGRRAEHEAYYDYMDSYLSSSTLLDQKQIFRMNAERPFTPQELNDIHKYPLGLLR